MNPGFVRRIVGVPKAESDAILQFLFRQISENPDFQVSHWISKNPMNVLKVAQVRFRWERNDVAIWDNRVVMHAATFDFFPQKRHALRVTPHGERPLSVAEYEAEYGKEAKDRQLEVWRGLGVEVNGTGTAGVARGYND